MGLSDLLTPLVQGYSSFIHSPIMQHYGMLAVAIIGLIPSFVSFIPDESFLTVIYQSNPTSSQLSNMFIVYGFAVFGANLIVYFLAHHLTNIIKKEKKEANQAKHFLFKYKIPIFLLVPSLIFGIGDLIVIYAGIKHINIAGIVPFLFIGSFIRAGWALMIVTHIPMVPT